MNHVVQDREGLRLKAVIEKLNGKYPGEELHKIEYKPGDTIYLLDMPPAYRWKNMESL